MKIFLTRFCVLYTILIFNSSHDFVFAQGSPIGAAKRMTSTTDGLPETVTIDYVFENFSIGETIINLSSTDDLTVVFGTSGVDWTFTSISSVPASLANPTFDGNTNDQLINQTPTQSLLPGATATITVTIELLTFAGIASCFCNQMTVNGQLMSNNNNVSDVSTDGTDPDPAGDGDPAENEESCAILSTSCTQGEYFTGAACTACASGTYQPTTGRACCIFSEKGRFQAGMGAQNCDLCPMGTRGEWRQLSLLEGLLGVPEAAGTIANMSMVYLANAVDNFWMYIPKLE